VALLTVQWPSGLNGARVARHVVLVPVPGVE